MTHLNELENALEDALDDRRIARNEFNRLCNCKASLGDSIVEAAEIRLHEAGERVKAARKALKAAKIN